jgi:SPP1 gp7 family putative phage head morphogenesis protein
MTVQFRFDLAPEEAVEFFHRKGLAVAFDWRDQWTVQHDTGFVVAKMADLDLLADVKTAVETAIAEGQTLAQFKKDLMPMLVRAGWWGQREQTDPATGKRELVQLGSARRLETIFRTNLMTAYSVGEWERIEETASDAPYLMYDAVGDKRTRDQHRSWDGLVLRWDDPWWREHYPPNGWNCRCSVIQLDEEDLRGLGKAGPDEAPPDKRREWVNRRTGEVMQIPTGVDPGFNYSPGRSRVPELRKLMEQKRQALETR